MTNKIGVTGFVLSLIGFLILPLAIVLGLVGLILSIIGVVKASKDPSVGKKSLCIAGIILAALSLISWFLFIPFMALLIVGILGGIPAVGGGSVSNSNIATSYWQTSSIGVDGFRVASASEDSLILKNNLYGDINVTKVSLGTNELILDEPVTILKGRTKEIQGEFGCETGGSFAEILSVTYLDVETNSQYAFVSDMKLEGTCVQ